jgi:hypothetical protein
MLLAERMNPGVAKGSDAIPYLVLRQVWCLGRIDTVAVKRPDPRNAVHLGRIWGHPGDKK